MKKTSKSFFLDRLNSFRYAFKGAYLLISTEPSIMIQFSLAILSIPVGLIIGITKTEWLFQIFSIGLVLSIEGLNTALEKLCDFVHPDYHNKIAVIKDIGAGAVILAVIASVSIILIIYLPYLIDYF